MLRQDSMSNRMAQVTLRIEACGGQVEVKRLDVILREFGITRQKQDYKTKLVDYGYLAQDHHTGKYRLTDESKKAGTIHITVKPSLYAEEVRRHLVEMLAAYDAIEISDVVI